MVVYKLILHFLLAQKSHSPLGGDSSAAELILLFLYLLASPQH